MAEPISTADVQARNRAGDLDYVTVERPDTSTWLDRVYGMLKQGGWQDPVPGQRGTFVPSKINEQGKAEPAVPGILQQPAEGLASLMTAPLSDIVRSGDRDAMRAAAEASFDVASMLPAAGVAAGRTMPTAREGAAPLRTYHGRRDPNPDFNVMRNSEEVWSSTNPSVAGDYASKYGKVQGAVVPMDTTLTNPMRVQPPKGAQYDAIPFDGGTYDIRELAKMARERGHDGMIVQGVMDSPELPAPPGRIGDTVVSFRHGSVKSPLTGETLFSNADDPTTAAILASMTGQGEKAAVKTPLSIEDKIGNIDAIQSAIGQQKPGRYPINERFDAVSEPSSTGRSTYFIVPKGKDAWSRRGASQFIGRFDVRPSQRMDRTGVEVTNARVNDGYQRQGLASGAYDRVAADFADLGGLHPSPLDQLSPDAQAFWKKRLGTDTLSASPDDPTTAAILALLTQQQGQQQ